MKVLLLTILAIKAFPDCNSTGVVCGDDARTYRNGCECQNQGRQIKYYGPCGQANWVPQFDSKVIGQPAAALNLTKPRYAWGWERPVLENNVDRSAWINWKWDKVHEPVYDFTKDLNGIWSSPAPINYNYNDWNWGNWRWLNEVQNQKQNIAGTGCCNVCVDARQTPCN